jgi:hypothetical protein
MTKTRTSKAQASYERRKLRSKAVGRFSKLENIILALRVQTNPETTPNPTVTYNMACTAHRLIEELIAIGRESKDRRKS